MPSNARWLWFPSLVLLLAGCARTQITNMSPTVMRRTPEGLYALEARWDTNLRAVRDDSMTPSVVVGAAFYPMQRSTLNDRCWIATVPVPPGQRFLNYRFKFDYLKAGFGGRHPDSKRSRFYQIEIVD